MSYNEAICELLVAVTIAAIAGGISFYRQSKLGRRLTALEKFVESDLTKTLHALSEAAEKQAMAAQAHLEAAREQLIAFNALLRAVESLEDSIAKRLTS